MYARRAGSDFDAATALVFMSWCLRRGPVARAGGDGAAAKRWMVDAEGARAGSACFGCRAVLLVMVGRSEEARGEMELRAGRVRRPAARPDGRVPRAARRARRDARGRSGRRRAGGARRRGDGLRPRRPVVPGDGQRRPRAHRDRPGPAGRRGGCGRADRRRPGALRSRGGRSSGTSRGRCSSRRQPVAGLEEAEAAVALAETTPLLLVRADAQRALATRTGPRAARATRRPHCGARSRWTSARATSPPPP